MTPFAELSDISVTLGGESIFRRLSLRLERGVSYALIGKSGVGKSTLLHVIAGFLAPDEGVVRIGGENVNGPRKGTVFLQQELGLFPWQTVAEAVSMPLLLSGGKNAEKILARTTSVLDELGLGAVKSHYPHQLSGGQRQRVALARTLIGEPDFWLMDEPTSSLDTVTKESIQHVVLEQKSKLGTTLLFVTHDIEEAVLLGDRILLLEEGGVISERTHSSFRGERAREEIGFYEACIEVRKWLNGSRGGSRGVSDEGGKP